MENCTLRSSKKPSTRAREFKQAGTKSAVSPLQILCGSPETINPAILLAEELMRKGIAEAFDPDDIGRAEKTLLTSRREIELIERQFKALVKTPPTSSGLIPTGF